jgi:hypothetical protein
MAKYKGYNIKTKLELEFAKKLTEDGIVWQYKPKTFKLPGGTYTPTFYLSDIDTWVVVITKWNTINKKTYSLFAVKYSSMRIWSVTKQQLKDREYPTW